MNAGSFVLQPFSLAGTDLLKITGSISRTISTLSIRYEVWVSRAGLMIPPPVAIPARKERLWEETCLEFFLAVRGARGYWEFNLSPSGHWNVYRFSDYREEMQEEPAYGKLPFRLETRTDGLILVLECSLARIIPPAESLEVAVSAVLKHADQHTTYWALTHPGPQPDFHRRDGFLLQL